MPKGRGVFFGAVVLVLALLPVGYFYFLGGRAAPVPEQSPAPKSPHGIELRLGKTEGRVELRRGAGAWAAVREGQVLHAADAVRTDATASALLVAGGAYEVQMEPGTSVSVGELKDSISKLMLESGIATATVHHRQAAPTHQFEVHAAGTDAVARTAQGKFAISNDGTGVVAVGGIEGEVEVMGQGKAVLVRAGQRSVVRPHAAPSEPTALPGSLLLKVQWPTQATINRRKLVILGEADPGAIVEVGGQRVPVDVNGHFSLPLQLTEGKNSLNVRARAVGAVGREERHTVDVDTTPPKVGLDKDLWKK